MKRDPKLIKEILLDLRDTHEPEDVWVRMTIKKYDLAEIQEHLKLLCETGYIEAIDASSFSGPQYIPQRLTNQGHSYLDEISKPFLKKIKDIAINTSGKIIWVFIGGFIGAVGATLANHLLSNS